MEAPEPNGKAGSAGSAPDLALSPALRRLANIPVSVSVELDRRRIRLRDILDLRVASVIKLARSAGENVDLMVEGIRVANGEIVVIEDTMGLRVTDIVNTIPHEEVEGDDV